MKKLRAKAPVWIAVMLLFCLGAQSASAARLRLITLKCFATEDDERDEARITVTGEGQLTQFFRNMRRGSVWRLYRDVIFREQVDVVLYDLDGGPFDANDWLGTVRVTSQPTNGVRTVIFNRDGAHYELRYRVDE